MDFPGAVPLNRLPPAAPPGAYRTYGAAWRLGTHFRKATCEEAACEAYRSGWVTTVDLSTGLGQRQARYIAGDKSRRWTMQRTGPSLVKFIFGPGQQCYAGHRVHNGRPPRLVVAGGDWRGNPSGFRRVHTRPQDWVEDQQEHLDQVRALAQRG